MIENLRNIAIIAHVDHGKTTLVDKLLQQSGLLNKKSYITERILDSNDIEKERGITIFSKNTSINWKNYRINIVDTPGHADFGGEVERIMSMVDSVLLLVDAVEGPMPQTKFVTQKAFDYGLKPIVVINKIDRKDSRPNWVLDQIFDLFINLKATDYQLDFPIIYTSAIKGIAGIEYKKMSDNMSPLLKCIIENVKPPIVNIKEPFQMQISQREYSNYLGVIGIGRVNRGTIKQNQNVIIINKSGKKRYAKIGQIFNYVGLQQIESKKATAGNIVIITGLGNINISDTICDLNKIEALPPLKIDEPTVSMFFSINNSPFCGQEGKYITSRQIFDRLKKELINNISLKVEETDKKDIFCVSGRGELHLAVLIENMRREGFELSISKPKVIIKKIDNLKKEPFEIVILDIEKHHQGIVIESISIRKGEMKSMLFTNNERIRLEYIIPSRGLIGFRSHFLTITSGSGLINSAFSHYDNILPIEIGNRKNGALISNGQGKAVAYALNNIQDRGNLFINHGDMIYKGQIIGMHNRSNDLIVNCLTGKKLTNMRASGTDEAITLTTSIKMSLEKSLEFINDDELVEVTPKSIRIRKLYLNENERKKNKKKIKL